MSPRTFTEVTGHNGVKNWSMLVKPYPCKKVLPCSVLNSFEVINLSSKCAIFQLHTLKCNHLHVKAVTYSISQSLFH